MTLDYATCRALKEAGFPQETYFTHVILNNRKETVLHRTDWSEGELDGFQDHCASPQLSELIAGCGEEISLFVTPGHSIAHNRANSFTADKRGDGPTPKAALAALYLAIHGKENV